MPRRRVSRFRKLRSEAQRRRRRVATLERLERRDLLAGDFSNPFNPFDVDDDGHVVPLDVLLVVSDISTSGSRELSGQRVEGTPFLDANGDGLLSPLDVLTLVNEIVDPQPKDFIPLRESAADLAVEGSRLIELGQEAGTRALRLQVLREFDLSDDSSLLEDVVSIYVVDPNNPSQTLLDDGEVGTPVFQMIGESVRLASGVATFDGDVLELDLTSLGDRTEGRLLVQWLNTDADSSGRTTVRELSNVVDPTGMPLIAMPRTRGGAMIGPELDIASLVAATEITLIPDTIRYDSVTGDYRADIRLKNVGDAVGRSVALVLNDLPAGVTLANRSGEDAEGAPYLNLVDAIPFGGLGRNEHSEVVSLQLSSSDGAPFSLAATILTAGPNRPPQLATIDDIDVMPGETVTVQLDATDADGDPVMFDLRRDGPLPSGMLDAMGKLTFRPVPGDEGTYSFELAASDGHDETTQAVTLNVLADPVATTRVSGIVLNTDLEPLPNITVDLGELVTTTAVDGTFELETSDALTSDTLRIHGEEFVGDAVYPFIAEKIPLVLGRDAIAGASNVIDRPIYLPALDVDSGMTIDPVQDTMVTTDAIPGASVLVAAGTLEDHDGNAFTGQLSITEVPPDLTPAALPPNLFPDLVVTIQPGEMVFTQPAPLTFPNNMGWEPGTEMPLWSINPETGLFDNVGTTRVSEDGTLIETIEGGVRNSSWHFPGPPGFPDPPLPQLPDPPLQFPQPLPDPRQPADERQVIPVGQDPWNLDEGCSSLPTTCPATSRVELHSGALMEVHELVTYQSVGQSRGLTLTYDSLRADARPGVSVGLPSFPTRDSENRLRLVGALDVTRDGFSVQTAGTVTSQQGLPDGAFIWTLPESPDATAPVRAAIQVDLSDQPSGKFDYSFSVGRFRQVQERFAGTTVAEAGQIVHVNSVDSVIGSGWGIAGLQQIVRNSDGSALLIDGDGSQLLFGAPLDEAAPYDAPVGDFSTLAEAADGTFVRTLPDRTVYRFNSSDLLASMTDRNGNRTTYHYDQSGRLLSTVDPVGLTTTLAYTDGRVSSITDPAGRVTILSHNRNGDLTSITDPDSTTRTFEYDDRHLMTAEIDKRGAREEITYDAAGRVQMVTQRDGSVMRYSPVQSAEVMQVRPIANLVDGIPAAFPAVATAGSYTDARGFVVNVNLDQAGQSGPASDSIGTLPFVIRNEDNLTIAEIDGRGNRTSFDYDSRGNVVARRDNVQSGARALDLPSQLIVGGSRFHFGDVNGDGIPDALSAGQDASVRVRLGSEELRYGAGLEVPVADSPFGLLTADVNGDGNADLVTANLNSANVSVALGDGTGEFGSHVDYPTGDLPGGLATADFNRDGSADVVSLNFSGSLTLIMSDGEGSHTAETMSGFSFAQSVTATDLNGDDFADLIVPITQSNTVRLLLGRGDGSFDNPINLPVIASPSSVAAGDYDLDGNVDLAVASFNGGTVSVLYGDGSAAFPDEVTLATEPSVTRVVRSDLDQDGQAEILAIGVATTLFRPNGGRTFAEAEQLLPVGTDQVADLNVDGLQDLTTFGFGTAELHIARPGAQFAQRMDFSAGDGTKGVAAGDFNQDGLQDFISIGLNSDDSRFLVGTADGGLADGGEVDVGSGLEQVFSADLNGDGFLDVVTSGRSIRVVPGNGDGTFEQPTIRGGSGDSATVAFGDFDNDQRLDFVAAKPNGGEVEVFLAAQDDFRYDTSDVATGGSPTGVAVGDFNADQQLDLVVPRGSDGVVVFLYGDGRGQFTERRNVTVGGQVTDVVTDDFDFDGNLDIAVLRADDSTVNVLLGRPSGEFGPVSTLSVPGRDDDAAMTLASEDVDGDGFTDLVTLRGDAVHVFRGGGNGAFWDADSFGTMFSPAFVLPADVNSDGSIDLATISPFNDAISLHVNGSSVARQWTYDPGFSQTTSFTDELGHQTLFEIDPANGNALSVRRVVGERDTGDESDDVVTRRTFTSLGLVETETDPLGRVTRFTYNEVGRLTAMTAAMGTSDEATVQLEYDAAGNVVAQVDANGNRTTYTVDAMNRLVGVVEADPDGQGPLQSPTTTFDYDENGNRTVAIDSLERVSTFEYDSMDRLTRSIAPDLSDTVWEYDESGNLTRLTDELGRVTERSFDARNRLTETFAPDGSTTQFSYDLDDNLLSVTDAAGNESRYTYDLRNRVLSEVDPTGAVARLSYDATNRLTRVVDRRGRLTEYDYDELDRLVAESWVEVGGDTVNNAAYTYDAAGNMLSASDQFSTLTTSYDNLNRPRTVDNTGTPSVPQVVLTYSYDPASNIVSVAESIEGQAAGLTSYEHDALHRATQVRQTGTDVAEKRVNFSYNALGQFSAITRFAATQLVIDSSFTYDARNRLVDITHQDNGQDDVAFFRLDYDTSNRITQLEDIDGTTSYSYDAINQLIGADHEGESRPDETYRYDSHRNRTASSLHTSYSTDEANRLASDGVFDYEYDANGSLLRRTSVMTGEVREFVWDHRDRLVEVRDLNADDAPTQVVRYTYDLSDRRISKEVDQTPADATDGVVAHFVYDHTNVLLDFVDSDGAGASPAVLDQRYLHGPAVDQVLAQEDVNGETHWHLSDHLGTVHDLVDSTGDIVNHFVYDSFGNVLSESTDAPSTRYLYTGRERDADTGYYDFRARHYDPTTGRFLSEDPIQFAGGDTNLYAYVANDPIASRDPSGLASEEPSIFKRVVDGAIEKVKDHILEPIRKRVRPLEKIGEILERILDRSNAESPDEFKELDEQINQLADEGLDEELRDALLGGVTDAIKSPLDLVNPLKGGPPSETPASVNTRVSDFVFRGCGRP